eukprot:scaffold31651_cov51-Phaeocystis_antarctica.AAC.2
MGQPGEARFFSRVWRHADSQTMPASGGKDYNKPWAGAQAGAFNMSLELPPPACRTQPGRVAPIRKGSVGTQEGLLGLLG